MRLPCRRIELRGRLRRLVGQAPAGQMLQRQPLGHGQVAPPQLLARGGIERNHRLVGRAQEQALADLQRRDLERGFFRIAGFAAHIARAELPGQLQQPHVVRADLAQRRIALARSGAAIGMPFAIGHGIGGIALQHRRAAQATGIGGHHGHVLHGRDLAVGRQVRRGGGRARKLALGFMGIALAPEGQARKNRCAQHHQRQRRMGRCQAPVLAHVGLMAQRAHRPGQHQQQAHQPGNAQAPRQRPPIQPYLPDRPQRGAQQAQRKQP